MRTENFSFFISDSIGSVSAELIAPPSATAIMTLAHGAGADMHHRFMKALAGELATHGISTLRFNFPYMERKKKMPDPPAIAEKTVSIIIEKASALFPGKPLFASGKSFGGRMTSQFLSKQCPSSLKGVIFYGFPLHAPGKPSAGRAAHLALVKLPMLFLQGTKDTLAELGLIKEVVSKLPTAALNIFEGADHSFKAGKKEFTAELAATSSMWINKLV